MFYSYILLLFVCLVPENGSAVIRHVCFIVNPVSNNGQSVAVWNSIHRFVSRYFTAVGSQDQAAAQVQPTFEVFITEHAGHGTELAQQAYQNWQQGQHAQEDQILMVAVGGDGTVHEVVQGLGHQQQVVFGVIPAGARNNIARELGLGNKIHALRTLVYGTPAPLGAYKIEACERGSSQKKIVLAVREFDLGMTTQAKKMRNDQDYIERLSRRIRHMPRSAIYGISDICSLIVWNTPTLRCCIDGGDRFNIPLNILVGGRTGLTSGSENGVRPNRQQGELLYSGERANFFWTLVHVLMQKLFNWSGLQHVQFTQLDIEHESETPQDIQVDGDILLQTPAHITWLPEALPFMRPPSFGDDGYCLMALEDTEFFFGSL
ncbi:diacylglycerol kinase family protein [Endozoicomonas sp. 4G]|uniref:diacylglycerol/lipid kinase family protein n=1 Tax=Endozoicomonas sp. 4G TaxID=2872754 RepID=UPI002078614C|nr:diacylglycerol kinase family protein [Endozoicomonas sp. 4G]